MITIILVFITILALEICLSLDNAAVLAVIVNKKLQDDKERSKALKYGILGAFFFRGLSLFLVAFLLNNPTIGAWFKILGGLYLGYLFYTHMTPEIDSVEEGADIKWLDKLCKFLKINTFWTTVIIIEGIDILFSLDNILAVVSLSSNMWIVCIAVFLGIIGMRFVAQYFSQLLEKYPSLEKSAFIVILLLGLKMTIAGIFDFFPGTSVHSILNGHYTDLGFSIITLSVFLYPILKVKFQKLN